MKSKLKMEIDELTKSNIWTVSESELSQMIIEGRKDEHYPDYKKHYMNIIRNVFDIQYLNRDDEKRVSQLEAMHFQIFSFPNEGDNNAIAIRKHQLKKVTDLNLENITHLEPYEVLELIKNNMGTGWKGLPLAIQDIIESAFFIDCSVLPTSAMHRVGGIIDRRRADGYEVLEIPRGNWTEGVFIKAKPKVEKVHMSLFIEDEDNKKYDNDNDDEDIDLPPEEDEEEDDDEDLPEIEDEDPDKDDDDDESMDLDNANPDISELEDIDDVTSSDDDEDE